MAAACYWWRSSLYEHTVLHVYLFAERVRYLLHIRLVMMRDINCSFGLVVKLNHVYRSAHTKRHFQRITKQSR